MSAAIFRTILVGTDGSPTARQAIARAAELALATGATLELVGAFDSAAEEQTLQASMDAVTEELAAGGLAATASAMKGDPVDVLITVADQRGADLIVVGNRGMTGTKRFLLGSVPDKISHRATCSVLVANTVG